MSRYPSRFLFAPAALLFCLGTACHETSPVPRVNEPMHSASPMQEADFSRIRGRINARRLAEAPDVHVYKTKYREHTSVAFDHRAHVDDYEIACIACHHVERCSDCHAKRERELPVVEAKMALHDNCVTCHQEEGSGPVTCAECHIKPEVSAVPAPEPTPVATPVATPVPAPEPSAAVPTPAPTPEPTPEPTTAP